MRCLQDFVGRILREDELVVIGLLVERGAFETFQDAELNFLNARISELFEAQGEFFERFAG